MASSNYKDRDIPGWDVLNDVDDEDVIDQSEYQFAARDHILFAIDASESMHKPLLDQENEAGTIRGKSALHEALQAVVDLERAKAITGPADSVGLLLYNVDASKLAPPKEGTSKPGTHVFQALRTINAEEIKRLLTLLATANEEYEAQDDSEDVTTEPSILLDTFPPCSKKEELNIADVFVACNFIFRDGGTKLAGNKRIFLVTDNDDPPGSATTRAPARTIYGDLSSYGIAVNTFFVSQPGHQFDPSLYWNDILARDDELEGEASARQDGLLALSEMMSDVITRQAPKRKQFSVPLRFGGRDGDIEIGVSGYAIISVQSKGQPKLVRMRGQQVEEVQTRTQYTSAETGGDLRESELTQAFQFGNEATVRNILEPNFWETDTHQKEQEALAEELLRLEQERKGRGEDDEAAEDIQMKHGVPSRNSEPAYMSSKIVARTRLQFSDQEIRSFRSMNVEPPQIKILGFQSPQHLLLHHNIKHSYFIYPDEELYTGSTRTFSALLKSCVKLERHALALCRFRANSTPDFCVLVPQEETMSPEGGQADPPGFHVIIMPFVDDLRNPPKNMTDNISANDEQVQIMEKLVRRLKFKSEKYVSYLYPNPALAYHQAQLQALAFDEDFDTELFDDKALPKYAGIHRAAGKLMMDWKRAIDDDERAVERLATGTKRYVVEVDESDLVDVVGAYQKGSIDKLKVSELKDYAKFHKISLTGRTKKTDIIDALRQHLDEEVGRKKPKKE